MGGTRKGGDGTEGPVPQSHLASHFPTEFGKITTFCSNKHLRSRWLPKHRPMAWLESQGGPQYSRKKGYNCYSRTRKAPMQARCGCHGFKQENQGRSRVSAHQDKLDVSLDLAMAPVDISKNIALFFCVPPILRRFNLCSSIPCSSGPDLQGHSPGGSSHVISITLKSKLGSKEPPGEDIK